MDTTKKIRQSKTIWGLVAAALPTVVTVLNLCGVPIPPGLVEVVTSVGTQVFEVVALAFAGYGRITATQQLTTKKPS